MPHTGGPQNLLDANVLAAQRRVIAVLRSSQERPGPRGQGLLEAAIKDMRQALALSLYHLLQQARRLQRQQEAAESLEASGGRIGTAPRPQKPRTRTTWCFTAPQPVSSGTGLKPHWPVTHGMEGRERIQ